MIEYYFEMCLIKAEKGRKYFYKSRVFSISIPATRGFGSKVFCRIIA